MGNTSFKQIDLLRKRRKDKFLVDPYFIENKKYIKQGVLSGLIFFSKPLAHSRMLAEPIAFVFIVSTGMEYDSLTRGCAAK